MPMSTLEARSLKGPSHLHRLRHADIADFAVEWSTSIARMRKNTGSRWQAP